MQIIYRAIVFAASMIVILFTGVGAQHSECEPFEPLAGYALTSACSNGYQEGSICHLTCSALAQGVDSSVNCSEGVWKMSNESACRTRLIFDDNFVMYRYLQRLQQSTRDA